jgi:hypothetical protein
MKKLLMILCFLFTVSGLMAQQYITKRGVKVKKVLEAEELFILSGDSLRSTTQLSSIDTTIVTLEFLRDTLSNFSSGDLDSLFYINFNGEYIPVSPGDTVYSLFFNETMIGIGTEDNPLGVDTTIISTLFQSRTDISDSLGVIDLQRVTDNDSITTNGIQVARLGVGTGVTGKNAFEVEDVGSTGIVGSLEFENSNNAYTKLSVLSDGVGFRLQAHSGGNGYIAGEGALSLRSDRSSYKTNLWLGNGSHMTVKDDALNEHIFNITNTTHNVIVGENYTADNGYKFQTYGTGWFEDEVTHAQGSLGTHSALLQDIWDELDAAIDVSNDYLAMGDGLGNLEDSPFYVNPTTGDVYLNTTVQAGDGRTFTIAEPNYAILDIRVTNNSGYSEIFFSRDNLNPAFRMQYLHNTETMYFKASGSTIAKWNSLGFALANGIFADEFSDDNTLADSSYTAIPTEGAVKWYVDNKFNSFEEKDSVVLAVDGVVVSDGTDIYAATSGVDFKTINGASILGSGNITLSGGSGGSGNYILGGVVSGRNIDVSLTDFTPTYKEKIHVITDESLAEGDTITLSINGGTPIEIWGYTSHNRDYAIRLVYLTDYWGVYGLEAEQYSVAGDNTGDQYIEGMRDSIENLYSLFPLDTLSTSIDYLQWTEFINNHSGGGGGTSGVTYVGLTESVTGLEVTGSPIISTGTFNLGLSSGYTIPTTTQISQGTTAFSWGDHASEGYGDVFGFGTPVNNQLAVFTGDRIIEGDPDLTWDGSTFTLAGAFSGQAISGTTITGSAKVKGNGLEAEDSNPDMLFDDTDGTADFYMSVNNNFWWMENPSSGDVMIQFDGTSGAIDIPEYGIGTFTGTVAYYLAVDASGNVIEAAGTGGAGDPTNLSYSGSSGSIQLLSSTGTDVWFTEADSDIELTATSTSMSIGLAWDKDYTDLINRPTWDDFAPPGAFYLTTVSDQYLDNEVVVGTTPNGILSGTWDNIGIDLGSITEAHLDIENGAGDGYMLTYSSYYSSLYWLQPLKGSNMSANRIPYYSSPYNLTADADFYYLNDVLYAPEMEATSDTTLKVNMISIFETDLSGIDDVELISFNWKNNPNGRTRYGVKAQQLETLFPEMVSTNPESGKKTVNYNSFLIAKVARQDEVIQELILRIKKLENESRR